LLLFCTFYTCVSLDDIHLLSIDSYCIPGSEGGGVFDSLTGSLLGLVLPPIRRRDGTASLNVILPLQPLLEDITDITRLKISPYAHQRPHVHPATLNNHEKGSPEQRNSAENDPLTRVIGEELKSLVMISLGTTWASGIIISPQGRTSSQMFLM